MVELIVLVERGVDKREVAERVQEGGRRMRSRPSRVAAGEGPVPTAFYGWSAQTSSEQDEQLEPTILHLPPGAESHRLGSDKPLALPTDGAAPPAPRYLPAPAEFRFLFFTLALDRITTPAHLDVLAALQELAETLLASLILNAFAITMSVVRRANNVARNSDRAPSAQPTCDWCRPRSDGRS